MYHVVHDLMVCKPYPLLSPLPSFFCPTRDEVALSVRGCSLAAEFSGEPVDFFALTIAPD